MRKITAILLCLILVCYANAQKRFTISFNQGFGSLPTYTPSTTTYTLEQAKTLFADIKNNSGIEFRYSYAGCEKRAHAISLLLKARNIQHYKIWNFDPSYISLFNKQQKPTVNSKAGLSPTVSWRYHVAILLFVQDNNQVQPMVLDPAVADKILSEKEWLDLQHASDSYYTYLDPQWYNYGSTDKFKYFCSGVAYPFPPCMDGLLTGDFFLNNDISLTNLWVEEALAVNQVAMKIIDQVIKPEPAGSDKRKLFTAWVENFDKLTNVLNDSNPIPDQLQPYAAIITPYKADFRTIRDSWKTKLAPLRN